MPLVSILPQRGTNVASEPSRPNAPTVAELVQLGGVTISQATTIAQVEADAIVRRVLDTIPENDPLNMDLPDFFLITQNALI